MMWRQRHSERSRSEGDTQTIIKHYLCGDVRAGLNDLHHHYYADHRMMMVRCLFLGYICAYIRIPYNVRFVLSCLINKYQSN